ncbi:similar to Saccharomyces cerevisiae YJL003W COX16 Mitochondrial inner membrane protein, required for assembly of cytochrome c oxidase [Maudiozyma barnettii]|uniref:Cytochrome c oxidase assembly protein COX16, mitochondrial n=1 Tax=Maudiozyma barnettii TaxID=61262 RepID=A0A8H2VC50_9SACH|nr:Cox16p [Kazachstania barnettii]CAB4252533.1 similar to Saccharomyces cerevisiae YJL003W COX16 Mitochondrial inner membrane protein, required for assembly of cytochrome c oxidase [Kazachstania barnettii]CAD1779269.1 similar to Saccharomyces cerevisiae YJL003W COX16 Mitochondrial inner membrane protein, required for assembly of cytochrome c oxidase [Kazachstania barnettii]
MSFGAKKFRSRRQQLAYEASFAGKYQKRLKKNPFLYFGLPFCGMIVLGSYWLAGFTQVKIDRDDRRVQEMNETDIINVKKNQRKFDIKDEYYKLQGLSEEEWEPVRVKRLKDESENVW